MEEYLFLEKLVEIENQYKEEQRAHSSFNIVRALHKIDDERRLHSRFIAYLLSPRSKHGMGVTFLKKFIAVIPQLKDFDLGSEIMVFPNEFEKSEKYSIDILIINKTTKQAIIIENKINAKDSNRKKKIFHASQIDDSESTYSNSDQEDIAQLKGYFDYFKVYNDLEIKYNDDEEEARKKIQLVYLTLNRKDPSLKDQFEDLDLILIDYRTEIKYWIESCINDEATNHFLKEILRQYLDITIQLTNEVERAKRLNKLISKDIDVAWKNKDKVFNSGDFKHVKWHTVFDFWNELTAELEEDLKAEIIEKITNEKITKQTHKEETKRIDRKSYGIVIKIGDNLVYITNDNNNGLTFGRMDAVEKKDEKKWFPIKKKITFSNFSNEETFKIINDVNRESIIKCILSNIKYFLDNKGIFL